MHQMHQNGGGMGHRRRGGRWPEHPKKADLPHAELSVQMQYLAIIDLTDE